jgi:hypothetical protein
MHFNCRQQNIVDQPGLADGARNRNQRAALQIVDWIERVRIDNLCIIYFRCHFGGNDLPGCADKLARVMFACRGQALHTAERTAQTERLLPLVGRKINVARRHGESVGFANGRASHDFHIDIQIAHHFAQHGELGSVLLSEVGKLRAHDLEQLRHHRSHSAEMAEAQFSIQLFAQSFDMNHGAGTRWIHLIHRGRKQQINALGNQ